MRIFLVAVLLLSAGVLCADVTIHNGLVTADLNSQPLGQVLDNVKAQTSINMSVDESVSSMQVSASFHDLPVAEAIKKMLEGTGVNYAVVGGPNGPESVFIGSSEKADQAGGNSRPPGYRSVVQPVMPQQPIYVQPTDNPAYIQQQQQMNDMKRLPPGQQKRMERQGLNNVLPPTGGGYAPNQPPPSPNPQIQQSPQQPEDQSAVDDSSDEEDDSEE